MEALYFTAVAIFLYFAADWILERIESVVGRRLDNRSLVFLVVLLTLALMSFAAIRRYTGTS
jgi:predicted PurR-regulated permease PerM